MTEATQSLYERLGGREGIATVTNDVVDFHLENPVIKARFGKSDPKELKRLATEFFCMGTGGPEKYTGKDMRAAHAHMNINDAEFNAVIDDIMRAMTKHNAAQREKDEVLGILYSLREQVVHV